MALHLVDSEILRTACRQRIESCELWLRRLLHDQLSRDFGESFMDVAKLNGQHIFNTTMRNRVASLLSGEPERFRRPIDALFLDDLTAIVCKESVFDKYFVHALKDRFPLGAEHVRCTLLRIIPIRNALSHANPIAIRDAERAFCYCSDVIESLIKFYAEVGMSQEYDAPMFTRFSDSLGNVEHIREPRKNLNYLSSGPLRVGDAIRLEVEVDAHYGEDDYAICWTVSNISNGESGAGKFFSLVLEPRHVNEQFAIQVTLKSRKDWHRMGNIDSYLTINYKVLPPIF
jgi:hypothetical protein